MKCVDTTFLIDLLRDDEGAVVKANKMTIINNTGGVFQRC